MTNVVKVHQQSGTTGPVLEAPPTLGDQIVGKDSVQTLTNKTLTAPTISGAAAVGNGATLTTPVLNQPTENGAVQVLAAAGSAQGDAGAVTAVSGALIHATGADGTKGIVLPAAAAGKRYMVKNADAANAILKVYPASGDAINALAGDAAISMAAKTCAWFYAIDATTWFTSPLLPS